MGSSHLNWSSWRYSFVMDQLFLRLALRSPQNLFLGWDIIHLTWAIFKRKVLFGWLLAAWWVNVLNFEIDIIDGLIFDQLLIADKWRMLNVVWLSFIRHLTFLAFFSFHRYFRQCDARNLFFLIVRSWIVTMFLQNFERWVGVKQGHTCGNVCIWTKSQLTFDS